MQAVKYPSRLLVSYLEIYVATIASRMPLLTKDRLEHLQRTKKPPYKTSGKRVRIPQISVIDSRISKSRQP